MVFYFMLGLLFPLLGGAFWSGGNLPKAFRRNVFFGWAPFLGLKLQGKSSDHPMAEVRPSNAKRQQRTLKRTHVALAVLQGSKAKAVHWGVDFV